MKCNRNRKKSNIICERLHRHLYFFIIVVIASTSYFLLSLCILRAYKIAINRLVKRFIAVSLHLCFFQLWLLYMINIRNLYNKCDTTDCILMIFVYRFITISFYLRRCVRSVAYIFRIFYPIYCIPLYCCFYKIAFSFYIICTNQFFLIFLKYIS